MATIFTKIIEGEIPSYKITEDDKHYAFLDINPVAEGHTLAVPKKETDYIFDLNEQELADLMAFSKKVARGMDRALDPIRTGIIVEGLEVPHAHVHLVPIYHKGQPVSLHHKEEVSQERMKELAEKIRKEVQI